MAVDGKWTITINSPMGAQTSELDLKADGDSLSGTQSAQGKTSEIANGKTDGDKVSWSNSITTPFPMTLDFDGTVAGDDISGNVKAGSFGSFPFSGSRAA